MFQLVYFGRFNSQHVRDMRVLERKQFYELLSEQKRLEKNEEDRLKAKLNT